MPANSGMFFNVIQAVAAFDVFEIGEYVEDYMELLPEDPVSEKFETIGMESKYFMNNMGSFFLALCFDLVLIVLWVILFPLRKCSKKLGKPGKKLGKAIFWNSWIITIF